MKAADRSFIRQLNRAFGPVEWIDDPLEKVFTEGVEPSMDHRIHFRNPLPDDFKPFKGFVIDRAMRRLSHAYAWSFGCPYGNSRCPKPGKDQGAGHHAGCMDAEQAHRINRLLDALTTSYS